MRVFVIHNDGRLWQPSVVDDDGTRVFLAWPSRVEAEKGRQKLIKDGAIAHPECWTVMELPGFKKEARKHVSPT